MELIILIRFTILMVIVTAFIISASKEVQALIIGVAALVTLMFAPPVGIGLGLLSAFSYYLNTIFRLLLGGFVVFCLFATNGVWALIVLGISSLFLIKRRKKDDGRN